MAWLGFKEGQLFKLEEVDQKTRAAQELGLFESLTATILPAEALGGRRIVFNCTCLRRPRPSSAEALQLIDIDRLLTGLDSYRERFFAFRYDLAPPPSRATLAQLEQQAQGEGDAATDARYRLVLGLVQLRQRAKAAQTAQPLIALYRERLGQHADDLETRSRLARLLVIAGQIDEAVTVVKPAVGRASAGAQLPPAHVELLATAVYAYALQIGLAAAEEAGQPRPKLPEVGWVLSMLSRIPVNSGFYRSPLTEEYAIAVRQAAAHFAKLQGEQLIAEVSPFLRFVAVADFLETLDTPLRPSLCAPEHLEGRLGRAVFATFNDRWLEAALRAKVTAEPDNFQAAYALGTFLICREVAIRTRSPEAAIQVGLTAEDREREVRKAARLFEKIIEQQKSPDEFPGARTYLAVARGLLGLVSDAQDILLEAFELPDEPAPEDVYIGTCISELFLGPLDEKARQEKLKQGRDRVAQYIASGKGGMVANEVAVTLDGIAGDLARASQDAKALTEIQPQNARLWTALGFYLLKQKDTSGALAALQKAVELDPEELYAQYTLGLAQVLAGNQEEGRQRMAAVEIETLLDRVSSVVGL